MRFSKALLLLTLAVLIGASHATTLKIAALSPDGSVWMKQLRQAGDTVAERTDGRVTFKFYPGGVMGDDETVLRKIKRRQLHGAVLTSGGIIPIDSNFQLYSLPLAFRSLEEASAIRASFDQRLLDGLASNGYQGFGIAEVGFAYAMSSVPVASVQSVREQKVWVPDNDPGAVRLLSGFGISGIPLSIADVLTGLQTGLINSIAAPPVAAIALQWYTQLTHGLELPLMYIYGTLVIQERQLAKLSPADRAVVQEVLAAAVAEVDGGARKDHQGAHAALGQQGMQWQSASAEIAAEWQRLADQANASFVAEGYIDQTLYADFQAALKTLRSSE